MTTTRLRPKTKPRARQVLGLDIIRGLYLLTDPSKTELIWPGLVQWKETCECQISVVLCAGPLILSPNFSYSLALQTAKTDKGAIVLQLGQRTSTRGRW